jgi:hypothetical protein
VDPSGKVLAIAREDGRLEVRSLDATPWTRPVVPSQVALPMPTGVLVVDVAGGVRFIAEGGAAERAIGSLSAEEEVVGAVVDPTGRGIVAIADTLYSLSSEGVKELATLPGPVQDQSLRMTAEHDGLIALAARRPYMVALDGTVVAAPVALPRLEPDEEVLSVAAASSGFALTTNFGRLHTFDRSGQPIAKRQLPAAGPTFVVMADDRVIAGGPDGWIRSFSLTLDPLDGVAVGAPIVSLRHGPTGLLLVGRFGVGSYWLMDADSLEVRQHIVQGVPRNDRVIPDASWRRVVALRTGISTSSSTSGVTGASSEELRRRLLRQDQTMTGDQAGQTRMDPVSASRWTAKVNPVRIDEIDDVPLCGDCTVSAGEP